MKMTVDLVTIRNLRKEKGIKQSEMARLLGYKNQSGYSKLETGVKEFTASELGIVAHVLDKPADSFLVISE